VIEPPWVETSHRIVVVSPHLDDGVLSLGASIASWSRVGRAVDLLTVLACDPDSEAPAGGWDRRGGFATEGESARGRREEDRRACAALGARPVWLPFGSVDYDRHGTDEEVRQTIAAALDDAGAVLVPGFPLSHPDHEWLAHELATGLDRRRTGLYAEQPYTRRTGVDPDVTPAIAETFGARTFAPVAIGSRDHVAKWRAIRCYRSQLPLLGMHRGLRRGPLRAAFAPEWVAWGAD
jgi:LmbE family N-acetylglucosaminyl deacetylase